MASLEQRNGKFRIVFRYAGQKFSRSLKTSDRIAAQLSLDQLEDNLRRVELGTLVIGDDEPSKAELLELQMIEDLLREDLSPIEQAKGFSALMESHGWNGKQVAQYLSVPASTVSRALALLDLPPEIQTRVDAGQIAARSAYEISKCNDEPRQRDLAARVASGMTLKETEEAVRKRRKRPQPPVRNKRLEFQTESGWRVIAIPPPHSARRTYQHLIEAIDHMTEDVHTRITKVHLIVGAVRLSKQSAEYVK